VSSFKQEALGDPNCQAVHGQQQNRHQHAGPGHQEPSSNWSQHLAYEVNGTHHCSQQQQAQSWALKVLANWLMKHHHLLVLPFLFASFLEHDVPPASFWLGCGWHAPIVMEANRPAVPY
jgi:hypothetical protein